jgi:hypothetical protein
MESKRCARCGGNMMLEPVSYEGQRGKDRNVEPFEGFECKCLLCCRVERDYSLAELELVWGVPHDVLKRMMWSQVTFIWQRSSIRAVVRAAELAEAA